MSNITLQNQEGLKRHLIGRDLARKGDDEMRRESQRRQ
jgi:hypothetical protein